jgi:hypothetical protein
MIHMSWLSLTMFLFLFLFSFRCVFSFSVYRVRNGECKIWSHSMNGNDLLQGKGWMCSAAWCDRSTVVSTDNNGNIGLYSQHFE